MPKENEIIVRYTKLGNDLICGNCGTTVPLTSKEKNRFKRRHPDKCSKRQKFLKAISTDVECVEDEVEDE